MDWVFAMLAYNEKIQLFVSVVSIITFLNYNEVLTGNN
jgi:hypothetical protein